MAATGVAEAEGYDATYLNPAGVVGPTRRRLTIGYIGARTRLRLNGAEYPTTHGDGMLIGVALPLPFGGVMKDRLAFGIGFFYPIDVLTSANAPFPDAPRLAVIGDRTGTVSILVSLGARVHERVSLGIGVLTLAALVGTIAITPDAAGRFTTVAEEQLVAGYTPVAGIRVRATRRLQLGVVFRGESKSEYDIRVVNSLGALIPIQLPTLRFTGIAQFDPMQLAIEASLRPIRGLLINIGITWKHWSAYPHPIENATPGAPTQAPTRFHDTAVPRIGLEASKHWARLSLHGRAGYFYEWSPAPRDQAILVDADRHALTAGVGFEWRGAFSGQLDAFGQLHVLSSSPRADGIVGAFGVTVGVDL
jgi:long-chain fatty acid transport protein